LRTKKKGRNVDHDPPKGGTHLGKKKGEKKSQPQNRCKDKRKTSERRGKGRPNVDESEMRVGGGGEKGSLTLRRRYNFKRNRKKDLPLFFTKKCKYTRGRDLITTPKGEEATWVLIGREKKKKGGGGKGDKYPSSIGVI